MAALESEVKPRIIRMGDCLVDFVGYGVLAATLVAVVTILQMPGLWPAAVLLALWGAWTPYHAVRTYKKIQAAGKPITVSLPDAWRRYYKGLQWSAFFSTVIALVCTYSAYQWLATQADDLASPTLHEILRTQLPLLAGSFFLTPTLLSFLSLWGRTQHRKARQKEKAVEIAAVAPESIPAPTEPKHWWTDSGVRAEVNEQKVGRHE